MFRVLAFTVKPRESADSRYRILQYHAIAERDGVSIEHRSLMGSRFFRWQMENGHFFLRLLLLPVLILLRLAQVLFVAPCYDAVWISREMLPLGPPLLESLLIWRCPRVILDIDDALHISDKESSRWLPRLLRDYGKFGRMASRYTAVVCGNAYLADFYHQHGANVEIIPTVVEADRYANVVRFASDTVRIGWIGTPLNRHHVDLLQPVFTQLAQQRDFRLVIVGLNEPLYWNLPNIRYLKWNLAGELDFFANFDIGIMPLKDSPFARGKCAFKLLQYMAVGLPVVGSPVGANCDVIDDGRNGFLAETPEQWLAALTTLTDDPELRQRMGESGRDLVRRSYSVESAWPPYSAIFKGAPPHRMSLRRLPAALAIVCLAASACVLRAASRPMQLGIDADNWSGQISSPAFANSITAMNIDFISWHIQPEEEADPKRLMAIVNFCRAHHWHYLFNTEIGNFRRDVPSFQHADGTYRYDLAEKTLVLLKNDPLFLGVVYDEIELMQAMLGFHDEKGTPIKPYLADTRNMPAPDAFLAVANKITELSNLYRSYNKRLIFEMVFPDYPFAVARGGALLAPKLLKENFNDLMLAVYRGAAIEYHSPELWACVDLWFLDKFPTAGKSGPGFHTPQQLLEALQYADTSGFDYVYIEQVKALLDGSNNLTDYGRKVIEFQTWRKTHPHGDWRTLPIQYYVKRFSDGYWGQDFSPFIPDHPYGSWRGNPYRQADTAWFRTLNELSNGVIPIDADTWNAMRNPAFESFPYRPLAGLPPMVVFDHFGTIPVDTKATVINLCSNQSCR